MNKNIETSDGKSGDTFDAKKIALGLIDTIGAMLEGELHERDIYVEGQGTVMDILTALSKKEREEVAREAKLLKQKYVKENVLLQEKIAMYSERPELVVDWGNVERKTTDYMQLAQHAEGSFQDVLRRYQKGEKKLPLLNLFATLQKAEMELRDVLLMYQFMPGGEVIDRRSSSYARPENRVKEAKTLEEQLKCIAAFDQAMQSQQKSATVMKLLHSSEKIKACKAIVLTSLMGADEKRMSYSVKSRLYDNARMEGGVTIDTTLLKKVEEDLDYSTLHFAETDIPTLVESANTLFSKLKSGEQGVSPLSVSAAYHRVYEELRTRPKTSTEVREDLDTKMRELVFFHMTPQEVSLSQPVHKNVSRHLAKQRAEHLIDWQNVQSEIERLTDLSAEKQCAALSTLSPKLFAFIVASTLLNYQTAKRDNTPRYLPQEPSTTSEGSQQTYEPPKLNPELAPIKAHINTLLDTVGDIYESMNETERAQYYFAWKYACDEVIKKPENRN